jgi:hypothetical protein
MHRVHRTKTEGRAAALEGQMGLGQRQGTSTSTIVRRKDLKPAKPLDDAAFLRRAMAEAQKAEARKERRRRVEATDRANRRAQP